MMVDALQSSPQTLQPRQSASKGILPQEDRIWLRRWLEFSESLTPQWHTAVAEYAECLVTRLRQQQCHPGTRTRHTLVVSYKVAAVAAHSKFPLG